MGPMSRYQWIQSYIQRQHFVSIVDQDFVDAYERKTGATVEYMLWGANRCPQLGRDLATMAKTGTLVRFREGLKGACDGYPKWVWMYALPQFIREKA
jgi:hypothetical protein